MLYKSLLEQAKKPALWQRSGEAFWDDDYISAQMLEAHLNPAVDAASRRPETIEQTVQWLSSLAVPGSRVLDLGCGPGLYTKRLSDRGYAVTGVDLSRRSIAYAKAADSKTDYLCRDYLRLDMDSTYDMVLMIYCDYAALTREERQGLLATVKRLLSPNGFFVFDVFTDAHNKNKQESSSWYLCETDGFWCGEPHLCLEATWLYENGTVSADQCVVVTANETKEYIIWDAVYSPERLTAEAEASGLTVKGLWGDTCGKPYTADSDTLCCILAK